MDKITVAVEKSLFDFVVLYLPKKLKLFEKGVPQPKDFHLENDDIYDINPETLSIIDLTEYEKYKTAIAHLRSNGSD